MFIDDLYQQKENNFGKVRKYPNKLENNQNK